MVGTDKMRFCNQCSLHVYNLSAMTRDEAEHLVLSREGRLCVRLYKRSDGTVITEDCPKGLEKIRRRMKMVAGVVAGALATLLGMDVFRSTTQCSVTQHNGAQGAVRSVLQPPPGALMGDRAMPLMGEPAPVEKMGKMALPAPSPRMGRMARSGRAEPPSVYPTMGAVMGDVAVPERPASKK